MTEEERAILIKEIHQAFSVLNLPSSLYEYSDDKVDDLADVLIFAGIRKNTHWTIEQIKKSPSATLKWPDVTADMVQNNITAFCYFSNPAFKYYLPAAIALSLTENEPEMLSLGAILSSPTLQRIDFTASQRDILKKWAVWVIENAQMPEEHKPEILKNIEKIAAVL